MSWYNKQDNNFIDGTQQFTLGDTTSNITIINNGGGGDSTDLGFNSTITDFLELKFEDDVFNLYLKNTNPGGSIFLKNDNNDIKIKIEDGILYVYYDYNFLISATITSGWTNIADYLVQNRQGINNNAAALVLAAASITTLQTEVSQTQLAVGSVAVQVTSHEGRIVVLENRTRLEVSNLQRFRNSSASGAADDAVEEMLEAFNNNLLTVNSLSSLLVLLRTKNGIIGAVGTILTGAGLVGAVFALIGGIIDAISKSEENDNIKTLLNSLNALEQNSDKDTINKIYHLGLTIDQTTNNGDLINGIYEVDIQNGGKIQITVSSGIAKITDTISVSSNSLIGDVININKTDIGGTSGILVVNVDAVYSLVQIMAFEIEKASAEIASVDNRQRRRQAIPDKNDFNNGFSITETTELQESGEELPSIAIDLKIDTAQFEYDNSGNLQLISYSKIGEIGNPSSEGVEATGIYLTTETNTGNIADLETDFTNVYKVLMNTGINYDNNTDYKLNIGYKEPFEGYAYNLICYALKTYTADVNNEFGNGKDFLGLYPVLTRLFDNTEIDLLEASSLELRSDLSFKKGELTFKNNTTIDLNNTFELVINLKPRDLVADVEYDILISKELIGSDYTYDNNRLKIFIKNNKLNIRHKAWATYQVGELRLGGNYFLNNFKFNYIIGINTNDSFWITDNLNYYYFSAVESRFGVTYGQDCGIKNNTGNYPITESDLWNIITTEEGANVPIYLEIAKPNNTSDTTIWDSPILYYSAGNILTNGALPSKNFGAVRLRFTYEYWNLLTWVNYTVPNQVILDGHNYKLQFGFSTNPNGASTLLLYRNFKTFGSYSGTTLGNYYEETFYFPELAPEITTTLYKKIEIKLVPLTDNLYPGPDSSQKYAGQIRLKLKDFRIYTYYNNALRTITNESIQTITSTDDVFPVDYNPLEFNTLVANIDLPNAITNGVKFYVDDVEKTIPPPDTTITVIDNTSYPFTIEKTTVYGFNNITGNNNIFSIGGIPASGEMNYSHFNWKNNTAFLTSEERVKLQDLINYKYYHETVSIDRYLKVKEFYGDIVDFRRVLVNGTTAYESLTPEEQETRLRTSDQSTGNVLIGNSFLEIGKLFVDNPTISGNLTYDFDTRTFSIAEGASINTEDVENIIDGLIKTTPSTYGLIFNDTDVNDKYLQLDNTYVNTLINLVLQNEVSYNTGFTDVKFFDLLIQVKDASIYSPYNLRELQDVNTLYNYVVNGSHSYLIRELNQLVQYHPLLGPAFGDYLPTGSFNFNGILAEDQGNTAIDFEVVSAGAQITYGDGYNNNKLQNGLSGGLSYIQNINVFPFSDSLSGCISCFHKPYGAFISNNIFEVTDVNEVNLLRLRVGYTSGFARYVLDVFNQTNTNFTQYIFNNSENEVYYENENSIIIYYDFPNIYMYVNGFKHDGVITTYTNQTFTNARFKINTSTYNDKSLLYELKVYDRKLFKDNDDIFNFKRVAEITEFYRINPISGSGLIIKELSGVQETKSRSITNKQTIETLESNTYTDAKVRAVLSASGGNNITWNSATNQFDSTVIAYEDSDVEVYLQNKAGVGMTYNTNTQLFDCDITQYTNTNVEGYIKTKGGVNITYNTTTKKFDNDITPYEDADVEGYIKTKGGVGITYNPVSQKFDCDITQYEDADVETYLQSKGGVGMTYNTNTQKFDCDIVEYTNTNLETALKFKGGTGLTYNVGASRFDCDITQYTDADVRSVLAVSDGEGITWDSATNKFKLSDEIVTLANQYDEADVETLLATKGGTNIYYNPVTKQFDNSITQFDQISGSISYATISDPPDLSSFITLGDIPVQYSTPILETELANKAGTLIDWNNTTKQFDVNIPAGTYVIPSEIIPQVQSDFNEINTSSPAFIANLPNILTKITSTIGGNNIYQCDLNHLFRNSTGESSFAVYDNKLVRVFGDIFLNDGTTLTTAPVQSDFNETNGSSLAYIRNKPFIPPAPEQSDFNENNISSLKYIQNKPTLPSLLSDESGVILNLNGLTFTNPNAFVKEGSMSIVGSTYTSASFTTIVEAFNFASGSVDTIISGLNSTFFTNGILGSQAELPGGVGYNLGQISGLFNGYKSEFKLSGSGTGTTGTFNSYPVGYSKFFCFNGGAYRSLRTKNIQSIMGNIVTLSFYWIAGNDFNGGNRPETNENFELQFLDSFGNLLSSILIHSGADLYPNGANFTFYTLNLNSTQQSASYIRWFQLNTSAGPFDQYAFTGLRFTLNTPATGGADIKFINLPTEIPLESNRLYKNNSSFLKIKGNTNLPLPIEEGGTGFTDVINIQSNWNENNVSSISYIKNKPNFITETELATTLSSYLQSVPTEYITETELTTALTPYLTTIPAEYITETELTTALTPYLTTIPIEYITETELTTALTPYLTTIPAEYITETELTTALTPYLTSVPTEYITETELATALTPYLQSVPPEYITETELTTALTPYLTSVPTEYITDTELATELDSRLTGVVYQSDLTTALAPKIIRFDLPDRGTQNFNQTTAYLYSIFQVPPTINTGNYTYYVNGIYVPETGYYSVSFNLSFVNSGTIRTVIKNYLTVNNDSNSNYCEAVTTYMRLPDSVATNNFSTILSLNAGDSVQTRFEQAGVAGNVYFTGGVVSIVKL